MSARLIKGGEGAGLPFIPFSFAPVGEAANFDAHELTNTTSSFIPPATQDNWRASAAAHAPARPAIQDLNAARTEAERVVADAQIEAERILTQAQTRAADIEREARERGLSEARANIAQEVATAAEPLRQRFSQTLEELNALRSTIGARTEREMVRLALEIARKVVGREVTTDPEIVLTLTRVALSRLHTRAVATVRLNPEDYAFVAARREQLESLGSIEIVSDRAIGRGGCLIETEMGDIDARVEQQFAEIERGFFG